MEMVSNSKTLRNTQKRLVSSYHLVVPVKSEEHLLEQNCSCAVLTNFLFIRLKINRKRMELIAPTHYLGGHIPGTMGHAKINTSQSLFSKGSHLSKKDTAKCTSHS